MSDGVRDGRLSGTCAEGSLPRREPARAHCQRPRGGEASCVVPPLWSSPWTSLFFASGRDASSELGWCPSGTRCNGGVSLVSGGLGGISRILTASLSAGGLGVLAMAVAWWVDVSTVEEAGLVRRRRRGPGVVLLLRRGGGGGSIVGGGRCRRGGRSVGTDGGGGAELLEDGAARGRVLTGVNSVTRVFETNRSGALLRRRTA